MTNSRIDPLTIIYLFLFNVAILHGYSRSTESFGPDPQVLTRKVSSGSDGCNKPSAVAGGNQPATAVVSCYPTYFNWNPNGPPQDGLVLQH